MRSEKSQKARAARSSRAAPDLEACNGAIREATEKTGGSSMEGRISELRPRVGGRLDGGAPSRRPPAAGSRRSFSPQRVKPTGSAKPATGWLVADPIGGALVTGWAGSPVQSARRTRPQTGVAAGDRCPVPSAPRRGATRPRRPAGKHDLPIHWAVEIVGANEIDPEPAIAFHQVDRWFTGPARVGERTAIHAEQGLDCSGRAAAIHSGFLRPGRSRGARHHGRDHEEQREGQQGFHARQVRWGPTQWWRAR